MNNDFGKYQELVNNWSKKNDMVFVLPEFLDLFKQIEKEGRVEGAKEIVDLIVKQQKVYRNNLDKVESKWLEGAVDCCNYLLQLIKEKRLKELGGNE